MAKSCELLNKSLPVYHFSELHECIINADSEKVMEAVINFTPESDPLYLKMMAVRKMPAWFARRITGESPEPFGFESFTLLAQDASKARVYGLAGKLWRPDFGLVSVRDGQAFTHELPTGIVKLALSFHTTSMAKNQTALTTETRVFCTDNSARIKFTPYWYLIRLCSGMIRVRMLKMIKRTAEGGL